MTGDQVAQLAFLVLLAAGLVFSYVAHARGNLNKVLQQAVVWVLIFVGVIAAIGLWDDVRHTVTRQAVVDAETGRIEIPRSTDGHYHLTLEVNGTPVRFVVDTGASGIVLTMEDARRVGLDPDGMAFLGQAMTANGAVRTAIVRLDSIGTGPVRDRNVPAFVNGGDLFQSLLGMSYLQRFDRIEISGDRLILERS